MNSNQPGGRKRAAKFEPRDKALDVPNPITTIPPAVQAVVVLPPHGALDVINATNGFLVVQCIEPIEVLTGFETENRYIIYDMFMRPMLFAFERSNALARMFAGKNRNFDMDFADLAGQTIMKGLRRTINMGDSFSIQYPVNNTLGVVTMQGCCARAFEIRTTGGPVLQVVFPACIGVGNTTFPVVVGQNGLVGEIVRLYPGYFQEQLTDADIFLVHFNQGLPMHLKLLLMAAVFLMDFTFFED